MHLCPKCFRKIENGVPVCPCCGRVNYDSLGRRKSGMFLRVAIFVSTMLGAFGLTYIVMGLVKNDPLVAFPDNVNSLLVLIPSCIGILASILSFLAIPLFDEEKKNYLVAGLGIILNLVVFSFALYLLV